MSPLIRGGALLHGPRKSRVLYIKLSGGTLAHGCVHGCGYSGMGVNDETDRGFRVRALDTVEVKNDLIW